MDDGCSPTVGILIFAGFVILDFVVFGFIAAMQNLNEAAIERLAGEEDRGAGLLRRYTDKNERYTHRTINQHESAFLCAIQYAIL